MSSSARLPSHGDQGAPFDRRRHLLALVVSVASVVLLAAGGLVTSTGSGLAVPDWPLSFGQVFPPMVGGVRFEHGHRLIAATVGLLTIALAAWFHRAERRAWVRRVALAAALAVVAQGLLGGLTVLLRLPTSVSVAHACLAQGFFCLTVVLAVATSRGFLERRPLPLRAERGIRLRLLGALAAGAVFAQLLLGAVMRHTGAGLAIPDVPLAFGRLLPPLLSRDIAIHFAHRLGALIVLGLVASMAARVLLRHRERADLARPAILAAVLVVAQILLGATTVATRLAVLPATAHVVTGALLLAACVVVSIRATGEAGRPEPGVAAQPAASWRTA